MKKARFLAACAFVFSFQSACADDFSAWSHSGDFRFNTTASGAAIAGDVSDFPVLIRLDSSNFPFGEARSDGGDLRFAGPDGNVLALELERWDAAARRAEIWVRVPLIKAGRDEDFIRLYWGNPAAAPASSPHNVFDTALGFSGVWHLNGKAVDATGMSADGDASKSSSVEALIAQGRSFDGANQGVTVPGAALNAGAALTVSAWIRAETWQGGGRRVLQKGDMSVQYALVQENDSLAWTLEGAAGPSTLKTLLPLPGAWHFVAAAFEGSTMRIYVDGSLAASGAAQGPIQASPDPLCLGCRGAQGKPRNSFAGRMDEVTVARVARSSDWIKLCYANQRAQQVLVLPPSLIQCSEHFGASHDTVVAEGELIALTGTADCATGWSWIAVKGPAPAILDPEVKNLELRAPRITKDTALLFRFAARFGDSLRARDVRVVLREAIPDPVFTLPALAPWNGMDSLFVKPAISNLSAVKASRDSSLHYGWTVAGPAVDTVWREGGLLLRRAAADGVLDIGLCLDNGGGVACRTTSMRVALGTGVRPRLKISPDKKERLRDAAGRIFRRRSAAKVGY